MRKLIVLVSFTFFTSSVFAQHFPGFRSGNYTGVNAVFNNPANIADSRYRWDVNLIAVHGNVGNSNGSFSLKDIETAFENDVDSILFGNSTKKTSGIISAEIIGPSFMFNAGKKNSFAITSRARIIGNVSDIDGNLIKSIDDENTNLPFTLNSNSNQKINANGWSEIGVSFARVLYNKGTHFLKAGITGKYLMGSTNAFVNINNLKGTLDENLIGNVFLTNASGRVAVGISGIDFDNAKASDFFSSKGSGIGVDLGVVYEYRPEGEKFNSGQNKYKLKVGLALLDIGAIGYKPASDEFGDYTINVPSGSQWNPSDLEDKSISEIKTYLDASPFFTNNTGTLSSYKAKLPTTLQANIDWTVTNHFSTELSGQVNLSNKDDIYSPFNYSSVTITPRYEGRHFGVYLPINYNQLTALNAGFSLRLGPLFLGSGSILTALLDKSKQADLFFGIRFGALQKK